MDGFQVIIPGLQTSVQDLGFHGFLSKGICLSGAMDTEALMIANILVGNPRDTAGLEVTVIGPTLRFLCDTIIAVTGAAFALTLDGAPMPMYTAVPVQRGQTLAFGQKQKGLRAYIAFSGGLDIPDFCGSKSTILKGGLGGFEGRALKKGDSIGFLAPRTNLPNLSSRQVAPKEIHEEQILLRYIPGPQDYLFPEEAFRALESEAGFVVTEKNNRQGYRLDGPEVKPINDVNIVSDGVAVGALQISPSWKPFLLLCETSPAGGYAKIGTVISVDLPLVAQVTTGARIQFSSVSIDEGQALLKQREKDLSYLEEKLNAVQDIHYTVYIDHERYDVSLREVF